jgi:hypothetical protein
MSIIFSCRCSAELQVDSRRAGSVVICPTCKQKITVPAQSGLENQSQSDFLNTNAAEQDSNPDHDDSSVAKLLDPHTDDDHVASYSSQGQQSYDERLIPQAFYAEPFNYQGSRLTRSVIAVGVVGCIFGLVQLIIGGMGIFDAISLLFTLDEPSDIKDPETGVSLSTMILIGVFFVSLMIVLGCTVIAGSIGLFRKKKWGWFVSVICGFMSTLFCFVLLLGYYTHAKQLTEAAAEIDLSDEFQREIYSAEVTTMHITWCLLLFTYVSYSVCSLWFLLKTRNQAIFFHR